MLKNLKFFACWESHYVNMGYEPNLLECLYLILSIVSEYGHSMQTYPRM